MVQGESNWHLEVQLKHALCFQASETHAFPYPKSNSPTVFRCADPGKTSLK
jgi:hypothetical protein